jgi:uncharacterized repeat protein (TIGR01451 family)
MMKSYNSPKPAGSGLTSLSVRFGLVTLMLGTGIMLSAPAYAAPPPANSVIGNQAIATYQDASGAPQTTLSNLVETTVEPVGSVSLEPNNTKNIIAGQTAYLPHTLINTGNIADSFALTFSADSATHNAAAPTFFKVYADTNADGVPDNLASPMCTVSSTYVVTDVAPAGQNCSAPPSISAGGALNFVIAIQSPTTATGPNWEKYIITATGVTYPTSTDTANDAVNITTGAVFDVTKSISVPGGSKSPASCLSGTYLPAGGCSQATYSLKYTNNGNAAGTIYIQDTVGKAGTATAGLDYIAASGKWSSFPARVLTDADDIVTEATDLADANGSMVYYKTTVVTAATATTPAETKIEVFVTGVPQNVSGTITFNVGIASTAVKGTSTTTNTALFSIDADNDPATLTPPLSYTNPAPYDVGFGQTFGVSANDNGTAPADATTDTSYDNATEPLNVDVEPTAVAGQTVSFDNYIWNTGSGDDTFDITLCPLGVAPAGKCVVPVADQFPVGTAFQLYKEDGVNPLLDTNGNSTPDTGIVPAGSSYKVVVKAIIPLSACNGSTTGTCDVLSAPFTVQKFATSAGDPSQTNNVFDQLTAITPPSVDLKNVDAANNPGGTNDALSTGVPYTTKPISPSTTTFFDLYVYNTSASADSYSLSYGVEAVNSGATTPTGTFNYAPAGWAVQFRDGTGIASGACSATTGTAVTSTNLLNGVTAGPTYSKQHICVVITAPSSAAKGSYEVFFNAKSKTSGVSDTKWDRLTIATDSNGLSLTPNNQGQIYPGGTIVYNHVLDKTGADNCTGTTITASMEAALLTQGWSALVYEDNNGDRKYDALDTLLTSATGTSAANLIGTAGTVSGQVNILVQVFAPNGAAVGGVDLVTLTANATCGTTASVATATDLTTVITGQLRLVKMQAIDIDCNGADGAYAVANITAKPSQCIQYQITATNEGITPVSSVVINDVTPAFTVLDGSPALTCPGSVAASQVPLAAAAIDGYTGAISCTWAGNLNPGAQDVMTFGVKINQ